MPNDNVRASNFKSRSIPSHPEKHMLGPTGKRLWMDYLDAVPGFSGRADFIHKTNIPLLFSVKPSGRGACTLLPVREEWRYEETLIRFEGGELSVCERKTITWEDQALSFQVWENRSCHPAELELILPEGAFAGMPRRLPRCPHGIEPVLLVKSSDQWTNGRITLQPGEKRAFLVAAAMGLPGEEEKLSEGLDKMLRSDDLALLMDEKKRDYLNWFDNAPVFECDDKLITACWLYRLYVLRKNLAEPAAGRLSGKCFYEGRGHRMDKTPYHASGWEFPRLIPLSLPLQVTDARWLADSDAARETLKTLAGARDENGLFAVTGVDGSGKVYAHYASWSLYQYCLATGDTAVIPEVLPAFKRDAAGVYESHRRDDSLQIEYTHALTGKEYQPSYWFFTKDCFPYSVRPAKEGYTPLKRVDRSVYTLLNFMALDRLCRMTGDADADHFYSEAEKIKQDILGKMWDPVSGCFYDLHYLTDEKAYVKNIVSVYPLWAGITGEVHLTFLKYLLSSDYFALGSGFASAAADCPVFSPDGGWRGDYFKGPHGCMWNGPSWPYATGIALDALARQSKLHGHEFDKAFEKHLKEYTREHFSGDDPGSPRLVEFYNSRTGEPLSEEADYLHSFYLDLIVRHLAGIEPDEDGAVFHPLETGMRWFSLEKLKVRGHRADVYYQKTAGERYRDLPDGYTVFLDGAVCYQGLFSGPFRLFREELSPVSGSMDQRR